MKVYVVLEKHISGESSIKCIFSSKNLADKFVIKAQRGINENNDHYWIEIEEYVLEEEV